MPDPGRPLSGVRVADLTMIWAGPYATKILADQGAEVIKIESPRAWDNIRTLLPPPTAPGEHWWNTNFYFHEYSRNKKSLSLDLAAPRGKEIFARLVAQCDVVIENYRTDVMDNLGLSYDWLRQQREDIIVVGMAGFGKTGPERNAVGYGPIIEMMSGLTSTSGYGDDGMPYKSGISYGDPIAGITAAAAVATALIHRRRTGRGQYIDLSQREAMSTMLGEFYMDWSMNQRLPEQQGNSHDWMAPHNIYPCAGEEEWIAICVRTDAEWEALKQVMGNPSWADAEDYSDQILRWEHREQLDQAVAEWTATRSKTELFESLRDARIPSSPVWKTLEVIRDPHLKARGYYEPLRHPEVGIWNVHGWLWRTAGAGPCVLAPAPDFGQHNHEILGGLLNLSAEEQAALKAAGVTATHPEGIPPASQMPAQPSLI